MPMPMPTEVSLPAPQLTGQGGASKVPEIQAAMAEYEELKKKMSLATAVA